MTKIVALIPCYNVKKYCRKVIEETLKRASFLILINDGSTDGTKEILEESAKKYPDQIHLISFPHNRGKGMGLLEGMKWVLTTSFDVLVTLDSDGQHAPDEIEKVAASAKKEGFAIGVRDFKKMPLKSRFANTIISFLLHAIEPNAPHDTQSGFRAFRRPFLEKIVKEVSGEHFEMEMRCIFLALKYKEPIVSCPIRTIYLDENRSSHFLKIKDSWRIMKALFEYWRSK